MSLLFASRISRFYLTSSGRYYAIKNVSLAFPNRGLVAIKGKSGSGKSTLLNLLSGLDQPSEGKVFFNGSTDISGRLGHEIGMVFQHYNLVEGLSVLQNVMLPARINGGSKKRAIALLKAFGLAKFVSKDVRNLSGGEKQRVAICRALVCEPRVVFADEPTGALDEKNSETVMAALKEISKKRLVVLVSHNEELIDRFADRIIEIRDGTIFGDSEPLHRTKEKQTNPPKKHKISWIGPLLVRNLRKHALKNVMCFMAATIGFSSLLLSLGFFVGSTPAIEREQGRALHYLSATLSKESETTVPGTKLKLIKKTRPSMEESKDFLADISDCKIVNDYSFFFPDNQVFQVEGEAYEPTLFSPVWDLTLEEFGEELLIKGEAAKDNSFSYCLANTEFFDRYGWNLLGTTIETSSRSVVTYDDLQNERFVDARLQLVGAIKEFGFLNSPRIYYSYQGLEEELAKIDIDGLDKTTCIRDLVSEAEEDSSLASYGWRLFLGSPEDTTRLFQKIQADDSNIKADSIAYGLRTSFLSLSEAFMASLGLFVGIAFAGVALILAMASFSSLVEGRKDNAILLTQGATRRDVVFLYAIESMLLCVVSATLSLGICQFLQQIANQFLKNEFDISGIINVPYASFLGVPWLLVWGLVLIGAAFGFLVSFIPISFARRHPLSEELRDE
ncbi:MAG: ABC transporter ATP-binding protein/permease [Bacilli bacterium]|nr:ABC transporter ATP-binding protein/permease [Bacilli bacterium]